jgi:hypothetical protein
MDASERAAQIGAALAGRCAEISADVYDAIMREIPELRTDRRVRALLSASVTENVTAALDIMEHGIDAGQANMPVAAEEYARRLAQRDVPMPALLRSYRIGATRFQEWCLRELSRGSGDPAEIIAVALEVAEVTAVYIDRISEQVVSAYDTERGTWLRNLGAARAARVRALLTGEETDVDAAEAVLGYRLRQQHVGVICWADQGGAATLARLERAVGRTVCFVPQDESCAWAWLPPDTLAGLPKPPRDVRVAFGAPGFGLAGFRRTHEQALAAQAVALASGAASTAFDDIAPLALMSGSLGLLRDWVTEILGPLAADDEPTARLRETLSVFLAENGSYKATAERLNLHKNTVQYRIGRARAGLGRPIEKNRLYVELALLAATEFGDSNRHR